jgi:hypothetical protein
MDIFPLSTKTQEQLYSKIVEMAKQYNENQKKLNPSDPKRLIVDRHSRTCRCQTCWYNYDGKDDVEYANTTPNSIETDVFNLSNVRFYNH